MLPFESHAVHILRAELAAADAASRRQAGLGHPIRTPRRLRAAVVRLSARASRPDVREEVGWVLIRTGLRFVEPVRLLDRPRR